ncbi:hypothetical protein CPB84DRAFT_1757784 [Gymnopilus junonius]|uniref:Actin cytoskeleton-regulatory complex protein SLA1 n=1 Tax=Gymnopilus junonius TaxID=109634 RepID=A0A9P5P2Y0_GYMJU|nr:hypothetical protein CPB84DRAFT_1757784 [Gymnopilus junonius]
MATDQPDSYLAILKASYDYQPQSEDEIAIVEDQILLLVERVDDEWWKVKIKASSQDSDSPVGLVPAAYVEQAEHTSTVKALYDYEASAPGELSINEGDVLLVFDTEEDWILVQNAKEEGKSGYVPGNYVEVIDEEGPAAAPTPSRIIVPDSPPPPASSYVDPADRVASSKVTADDIQTWSLSEIDKKGKKKKGTLGIGNGAVFFASEADKTPVQKWQTQDVSSASVEKSKHVRIDIGGSNPISLHFHAGSKENADSIVSKLNSSKALSSANAPEQELQSPSPNNFQPPAETTLPKKPSVHFSSASPVIIPTPEEEEEEEENTESYSATTDNAGPTAVALYDFKADGDDELSVTEGEHLTVLEKDGDEWWKCRNASGSEGVVPASYLEAISSARDPSQSEHRRDRETEERERQELTKQREAERIRQQEEEKKRALAARKAEAQQKAKQAAIAAEAERVKRMAAAASRVSPPPAAQSPSTRSQETPKSASPSSGSRNSSELTRPPPDNTRIWHDRSGQFRVEAAFLGFNNGKLRLHKVNGVIVEVPSEKMSLDDMRYVERLLDKKQKPSNAPRVSEDDIPLAISKVVAKPEKATPLKKAPQIDWFDFFLSAGCDLDDCTRYAASFERDKIDETLLTDITEGTMRSLGLREGDIIRVKKAIEKRKPTDNLYKAGDHIAEQVRRDEELARQLQAQETSSAGKGSAPNLFAGPGGVLKPRRGRPQPSKSLPLSNVDIKAISSASDQFQRTGSPQTQSPASAPTPSLPPRPSSAAAVSGFDNDAWTNRPSSTKPVKATSPVAPPRVSSVPPLLPRQPTPTPTPTATAPASAQTPSIPPAPAAVPSIQTPPTLAKTTESDIFDQLARLSALRTSTPSQPSPAPLNVTPPVILNLGLGMGSSPIPMGIHVAQPTLSPPVVQVPYNGPRGPFAPVPANQGLLQPLIPTQTGFNGFIPTKPVNSPSFQHQLTPAFMPQQPTGLPGSQPLMAQPTGVFSNLNPASPFGTNGFGSVQSHLTGFVSPPIQTAFGNASTTTSPPPPSNSSQSNNTSPANIFAQMKSGTFANDDNPSHNPVLNGQTQTWGQSYQGYTGY